MSEDEGKANSGTCAFCGYGDGYLGEQGDDITQQLHGAVRSGEPGNYTYKPHPNAHGPYNQVVTWCGECIGGLAHKYQRYDDTNLHALHMSYQLRMELDGLRWTSWSEPKAKKYADDPAVHMEKLRIDRDLTDIQNEKFRRAGFDLTTRGWRP